MTTRDTPGGRVACLTPPGQAALATLALRGGGAWDAVREVFRPLRGGPLPDEAPGRAFWLGRVGQEEADDAVLAVKQAGPEPWLEIHCHGGREVVQLLLEVFTQRGLEVCPWERMLGGRVGPLRGQAQAALARCLTVRAAGVLLDQAHGAFEVACSAILTRMEAGRVEEAAAQLEALARHAGLGRRLTEPWRVVVAGAPNVGKSSLVNALAGYQRSIVSAVPGTTRDVVTTRVAIDGWAVELSDTAGLREEGDELEEAGMARGRQRLVEADLVLWLVDASAPPVPPPDLGGGLMVINKIDLPPTWPLEEAAGAPRVSARTGEGLDELCQAISRRLVPEPPGPGAAAPFTAGLCDAIEAACSLARGGEVEAASRVLRRLCGEDPTGEQVSAGGP